MTRFTFFKRDPVHPHQAVGEEVGGGLVSTRGWGQRDKVDGSDGGVAYATRTKLARLGKLIFDKQDRCVHLVAIARMTEVSDYFLQSSFYKKIILTSKQSRCNQ